MDEDAGTAAQPGGAPWLLAVLVLVVVAGVVAALALRRRSRGPAG